MKRERAKQIVLIVVGLLYVGWFYPLFASLWHSSWLPKNQEAFPMFMSVNAMLGVFLLLAANQPARHRSLIAFGAWSSLAHAFTNAVITAEAWSHGVRRSPLDVVVIGVLGVALLAVLPAEEPTPGRTESTHSARMPVQPQPAGA